MKKASSFLFSMLIGSTAVLAGASAFAQDAAKAGNAAEGERKAAMCIGCHGLPDYKATFPEVYRVPMISGQSAKYISSALVAYQKGDRRHPTMRGIAGSLTDQDIADLAAFYETNGGKSTVAETVAAAPEATNALLTKGACASCHGANYSKPIDPTYPKLAGQHADYLYAAMRAYQRENGSIVGRNHAIMGAQAKPFKPAELKAIAEYIGSLPTDLKTVKEPGLISRQATAGAAK